MTPRHLSASQLILSLSLSPLKSPTCLEKTHSGFKAERGEPPFFSVSVSVSLSLSVSLSIGRPRKPFSIQVPISFSIYAFFFKVFLVFLFDGYELYLFYGHHLFWYLTRGFVFVFTFFLVIEYMGLLGYSLMW